MGRSRLKLGGHDLLDGPEDMPPCSVSLGASSVWPLWRPSLTNRATRAPYGAQPPQTRWAWPRGWSGRSATSFGLFGGVFSLAAGAPLLDKSSDKGALWAAASNSVGMISWMVRKICRLIWSPCGRPRFGRGGAPS